MQSSSAAVTAARLVALRMRRPRRPGTVTPTSSGNSRPVCGHTPFGARHAARRAAEHRIAVLLGAWIAVVPADGRLTEVAAAVVAEVGRARVTVLAVDGARLSRTHSGPAAVGERACIAIVAWRAVAAG